MATEKRTTDWRAELETVQKVCATLEPLDHETRTRVLAAVLCMCDTELSERVIRMWRRSA